MGKRYYIDLDKNKYDENLLRPRSYLIESYKNGKIDKAELKKLYKQDLECFSDCSLLNYILSNLNKGDELDIRYKANLVYDFLDDFMEYVINNLISLNKHEETKINIRCIA